MSEEEAEWEELFESVAQAVAEWRGKHPRAKLTEIEKAVDRQLAEVRVKMVEDPSQGSAGPGATREDSRHTASWPRQNGRAVRHAGERWELTGNKSDGYGRTLSRRSSWSAAKHTVLTAR
jgi:hypothetical protein